MTTLQTGFLAEISPDNEIPLRGPLIPQAKRAYFHERLKGRIYSLIAKEFLTQQKLDPSLSQAAIAKRLGKRPEQITRWFAGPQNYTVETISDLLLAICASELSLGVTNLSAPMAVVKPEVTNIIDFSKSSRLPTTNELKPTSNGGSLIAA